MAAAIVGNQHLDSEWEARLEQLGVRLRGKENEKLRLSLNQNDFAKQIDWEGENGFFADENIRRKLKSVRIKALNRMDRVRENFESFCRGLSQNRSIEELELDGFKRRTTVGMFSIIAPFFEHNTNFHILTIRNGRLNSEDSDQLASALRMCNSLTEVWFQPMIKWKKIGIVISALSGIENLRKVSLADQEDNENCWSGCVELGSLVRDSSSLQELDLSRNAIDDQVLSDLSSALMGGSSNLKILNLNSNARSRTTDTGWQTFCEGWQTFFTCLQNANCPLEELHIDWVNISEGTAEALSNAVKFHSLRMLDFSTEKLSTYGWCVFLNNLLQRPNSLERLRISCCIVVNDGGYVYNQDDIGLALSNALSDNCCLKSLDISDFLSIGPAGWQSFMQCFRTNTTVEEVNLEWNDIDEQGMITFVTALSDNANSGLKKILFSDYLQSERVCEALHNLVFNKENVNTIHSSNHTLHCVCNTRSERMLQSRILAILQINQVDNITDRVRQKILRYFESNPELEELVSMDWGVLPYAMSWAGRDYIGVPLLYQLFRHLPYLCGVPRSAVGVKRKR